MNENMQLDYKALLYIPFAILNRALYVICRLGFHKYRRPGQVWAFVSHLPRKINRAHLRDIDSMSSSNPFALLAGGALAYRSFLRSAGMLAGRRI